MEEGFDEFSRDTTVAASDGGVSSVEIVRNTLEARTTISPAAKEAMEANLYGDLPKEVRPLQYERELAFMTGNKPIRQVYSQSLLNPSGCVILGTNGTVCLALRCKNETNMDVDQLRLAANTPSPSQTKEDVAKTKLAFWNMYSKYNVGFWYKFKQLAQMERMAFYQTHLFRIEKLWLPAEADVLNGQLNEIAELDSILLEPIELLQKKLIEKRPTRTEADGVPPEDWYLSAKRKFVGVGLIERRAALDVQSKGKEEAAEGAPAELGPLLPFFISKEDLPPAPLREGPPPRSTHYELHICRVPKLSSKKSPHWIDTRIVFTVLYQTVPVMAFNNTHLVALLQDREHDDIMHLQVFKLGDTIKLEREFYFSFPEAFSNGGLLSATLDEDGNYAVAYVRGAIVLGGLTVGSADSQPTHHIILFEEEAHHLGKPSPQVISTCSLAGELLLIGTNLGGCYAIKWSTGESLFTDHLIAIEPIHYILQRNKRLLMQSVMGVTIGGRFIDIPRPVAIDTCGTLMFVLSKYGMVKAISCIAGQVARDFEPPKIEPGGPNMQTAYPGVKAFPDKVVIVYQDGLVRVIGLVEEEAPPAAPAELPLPKNNKKTTIIKKKNKKKVVSKKKK